MTETESNAETNSHQSSTLNMPIQRTRNQNGRLHQHHRNVSGGSSKVRINLRFTAKDPKRSDMKRTVHSAVDVCTCTSTHYHPID